MAHGVAFKAALGAGKVSKSVVLDDTRLRVAYHFVGVNEGLFRVTVNIAMPSCDGPAGRFRIDKDILGGFGQPLDLAEMQRIVLEDAVLGGKLSISVNRAVTLHSQPCFSVSQSEAGFEKIMQAVVLTFECPLKARMEKLEFCIDVA